MSNANKVILNTVVSYIALLLKMIVGLFTVRLVLQALGEVDYGVYILVGGIVAMLDILNSNMTNTSMRYLAYSLGGNNKEDICVTFSTTVFIHYLIGITSIILLEFGGYFMFEYIVNLPVDRLFDAHIIYQFMIVSTFISIISVPYDAVTNAYEKIWMLSIFDIISIFFSLSIAIFLIHYDGNRLIMYVFCLMMVQILMRIIKVVYAKTNFGECKQVKIEYIRRSRMKEILSFTGWNLLASVAALCVTQFRSLILNAFFGVRLNAAEGISRQVSTPLNQMVASMTRAINPQIMKNEGGNNREKMKYIVTMGAKYSTFLFAVFAIPVLIELSFLLDLWLDEIPEFAIIFCKLTIISMLLEKLTFQLIQAISAVGNIRNFQIVSAIANFIYLPIAWVMFKIGYPPVTIYLLYFFSQFFNALIRLYYGQKIVHINPKEFVMTAILPVLWPLLISTLFATYLHNCLAEGWYNIGIVFAFFSISFPSLFWMVGIPKEEKKRWKNIGIQLKNKLVRI